MSSEDLTIAIIFLLQTTVGVLGNFSLLYCYIFFCFTGCRSRFTYLIVRHLTIANSMAILSKGIPHTMAAFGWKDFLSDFGCKFLMYVHRVGRGVSIGSRCLLSMLQAITISPGNSRWAELKVKAPKCAGFSLVLCWVLHVLVNVIVPIYVAGKWGNKTTPNYKDDGYCSSVQPDKTVELLHAALLAFPDVASLGLMLWASGSLVSILHRHKQQVQHLHRNNLSPRPSPETRATQTILVLASTFVTFFSPSPPSFKFL
ncbi:vomeronasal type-1 receptor 4-like [Orycteropus afer afer]|uniref:Vomeronasal type-1 receptor 4-like n=1 Tax=Orycteropus afer afer TaxID=1230840 RepID=A0AC54ZBD6_ORYAF|nr:vomeronasal type-1 receptor 4-like [Orycteropus afer afer]